MTITPIRSSLPLTPPLAPATPRLEDRIPDLVKKGTFLIILKWLFPDFTQEEIAQVIRRASEPNTDFFNIAKEVRGQNLTLKERIKIVGFRALMSTEIIQTVLTGMLERAFERLKTLDRSALFDETLELLEGSLTEHYRALRSLGERHERARAAVAEKRDRALLQLHNEFKDKLPELISTDYQQKIAADPDHRFSLQDQMERALAQANRSPQLASLRELYLSSRRKIEDRYQADLEFLQQELPSKPEFVVNDLTYCRFIDKVFEQITPDQFEFSGLRGSSNPLARKLGNIFNTQANKLARRGIDFSRVTMQNTALNYLNGSQLSTLFQGYTATTNLITQAGKVIANINEALDRAAHPSAAPEAPAAPQPAAPSAAARERTARILHMLVPVLNLHASTGIRSEDPTLTGPAVAYFAERFGPEYVVDAVHRVVFNALSEESLAGYVDNGAEFLFGNPIPEPTPEQLTELAERSTLLGEQTNTLILRIGRVIASSLRGLAAARAASAAEATAAWAPRTAAAVSGTAGFFSRWTPSFLARGAAALAKGTAAAGRVVADEAVARTIRGSTAHLFTRGVPHILGAEDLVQDFLEHAMERYS